MLYWKKYYWRKLLHLCRININLNIRGPGSRDCSETLSTASFVVQEVETVQKRWVQRHSWSRKSRLFRNAEYSVTATFLWIWCLYLLTCWIQNELKQYISRSKQKPVFLRRIRSRAAVFILIIIIIIIISSSSSIINISNAPITNWRMNIGAEYQVAKKNEKTAKQRKCAWDG